MPADFARFQRVYDHLKDHPGSEFLRQRLQIFLHINHCIAEGELDLIHNLDGHLASSGQTWGISDESRALMVAMRRETKPTR